jgi:hypothetical protein
VREERENLILAGSLTLQSFIALVPQLYSFSPSFSSSKSVSLEMSRLQGKAGRLTSMSGRLFLGRAEILYADCQDQTDTGGQDQAHETVKVGEQ